MVSPPDPPEGGGLNQETKSVILYFNEQSINKTYNKQNVSPVGGDLEGARNMNQYIWLIPILPLAGFIINGLGRNSLSKSVIGFIGSLLVLVSFGLSHCCFLPDKINRGSPINC
jgi:hypothetical protein